VPRATSVAALFLATGTALAADCDEKDPNPTCDNPTGWIAQCNNGDQAACKALNDLLAQVDDDEKRPFEDRWHVAKWDCRLEWQGEVIGQEYSYPQAFIDREDLPKIINEFKKMKGHCLVTVLE
jgi:hypothetical protein